MNTPSWEAWERTFDAQENWARLTLGDMPVEEVPGFLRVLTAIGREQGLPSIDDLAWASIVGYTDHNPLLQMLCFAIGSGSVPESVARASVAGLLALGASPSLSFCQTTPIEILLLSLGMASAGETAPSESVLVCVAKQLIDAGARPHVAQGPCTFSHDRLLEQCIAHHYLTLAWVLRDYHQCAELDKCCPAAQGEVSRRAL